MIMRPFYFFIGMLMVLPPLILSRRCCGRRIPKTHTCIGVGTTWSSTCEVIPITQLKGKRGNRRIEKHPYYPQDDEERAMLKLRDEASRFLAMLLKEGRQEKQKSVGSNQNVYGSYSYNYDFQRYF